jgi:hypothetical protein
MRVVDLVRAASLRGSSSQIDARVGLRVGRALATVLARRHGHVGPVALGCSDPVAQREVRDGLLHGLLLSGATVVDVGACESEQWSHALRSGHEGGACRGGVLVGAFDDTVSLMAFAVSEAGDLEAFSGEQLMVIARVADDGAFVAGLGTVLPLDPRARFPTELPSIEIDLQLTGDDTREGVALG